MKPSSRRQFIKAAALSIGFAGVQSFVRAARGPSLLPEAQALGFGPLQDDPGQLMRLPRGFRYVAFSRTGEVMNDGYYVPGAHDGMAAFPGPDGTTLLVRNHEVNPDDLLNGPFRDNGELYAKAAQSGGMFDAAHGKPTCLGGTTTLVFDTAQQRLVAHSLSLAGTLRNCSGGPTPWGSWITCEEVVLLADTVFEQNHGYCFEVPASAAMGLAKPLPIKGMGRFNHEAVCVDPASGVVYLTEDRPDGLIYRYVPQHPGKLLAGGRLQALAIVGQPSSDTRNWEVPSFPIDTPLPVEWIDLDGIDAPNDDLRYRGFKSGAARFARGEGMVFADGSAYFACTNGGLKQFGQIFSYRPSPAEGTDAERQQPGELRLFVESHESQLMQSCDNLAVAPWGDIIICEDDVASSAIVGITPEGKLYHLAHVATESELAGACFSPDGSTLFVNVQRNPGLTLAITGPWDQRRG